jgi:hypothetical protein
MITAQGRNDGKFNLPNSMTLDLRILGIKEILFQQTLFEIYIYPFPFSNTIHLSILSSNTFKGILPEFKIWS